MIKERQDDLSRIVRHLVLHGSFMDNLGLLNGKIGLAIFFFHYAQYANKKLYDDFAGELIDQIYDEIHKHYPYNFIDGLCGIVWGIEYLIQKKFVEADADQILIDIDYQILEHDVRRIKDKSLETGLEGIARYVISRTCNRNHNNKIIPTDYIYDLINALKNDEPKSTIINYLVQNLYDIIDKKNINNNNIVYEYVKNTKYKKETLFDSKRPLGIINNGFAGIGIKMIQEA
ncbi:hypothetical protein [Dysgonomonas sp. ZJ279]|uniref:hypothetical protein n=1 Tax=Dysgonomonas sp. ZJ279 TaxID=2709796 RepID=UPI0013EAB2EA|nr:hypothetical protein [Dysgonomonas sp. ZJ279]